MSRLNATIVTKLQNWRLKQAHKVMSGITLISCFVYGITLDVVVPQRETEIELGSLLRQDFQGLHNELLLRLGEHYQQVWIDSLQTSNLYMIFF